MYLLVEVDDRSCIRLPSGRLDAIRTLSRRPLWCRRGANLAEGRRGTEAGVLHHTSPVRPGTSVGRSTALFQ
jgi:hypothetical protein